MRINYSPYQIKPLTFKAHSDSALLYDLINPAPKLQLPDVDKFEKITDFAKNNEIVSKPHSDFYKNPNMLASSYFRRGDLLGENPYFKDIINVFSSIFNPQNDVKKSMLIVGIGSSQEPFSYLATIKELIKNKKLTDKLDLQTVDLQAKPTKQNLRNCSHYSGYWSNEPEFAKSSFVTYAQIYDNIVLKKGFRVNDEIFNYLYKTYNNPQKSKWATRIQEEIKNYKNETFDTISINNVLGYITNDDEYYETIRNLPRIVKPEGYIIADDMCEHEFKKLGINLTKICYGIFKKHC